MVPACTRFYPENPRRPLVEFLAAAVPESDRPYEINDVARLTGLSTARLRAWERRYEVVRPVRQPNGYRAYTGEQVALLRALDQARRLQDDGPEQHPAGETPDQVPEWLRNSQ